MVLPIVEKRKQVKENEFVLSVGFPWCSEWAAFMEASRCSVLQLLGYSVPDLSAPEG